MKLQLIAQGSSKWDRFIKRWGISFLINEDVLFDTFGDERVFFNNLKRFQVDIQKIKHIIISHDHWDHIAGLCRLIQKNKNIKVYIGKNFCHNFKNKINSLNANIVIVDKAIGVCENIYTTGQILGKYNGKDIYEQSLVIETQKGICLLTGCAHPNIIKIVLEVKERFGKIPFAVIGGLHLKADNFQTIRATIKQLGEMGISKISALHCSGKTAEQQARNQFKHQYINIKEGQILDF